MKRNFKFLFCLLLFCFFVGVNSVSAEEHIFRNLEIKLNKNAILKTKKCVLNITDGVVRKCTCDPVDGPSNTKITVKCERGIFNSNLTGNVFTYTQFETKLEDGHFNVTKFTLKAGKRSDCDKDNTSCGYVPAHCQNLVESGPTPYYKNVCNKATSYDDMIRICEESKGLDDFMNICKGTEKDPEQSDENKEEKEASIEEIMEWAETVENTDPNSNLETTTCSALLSTDDEELVGFIKTVVYGIAIVGIVILILSTAGDFLKAITSGEADKMSDTFKRFKNRIIAVIILLLLPLLVNWIITFLNNYVIQDEDGTVRIGDVSECQIID